MLDPFVNLFQHLDDWSFNVFAVNDASDGHALKFVGFTLLQKYDLITKFKINTQVLESFLFALESGYSKYRNPYHNLLHGADVAQTVHYVLSQSKLAVCVLFVGELVVEIETWFQICFEN